MVCRVASFFIVLIVGLPEICRAGEPLRIGLLLCQSGSCAEWGVAATQGALLAAEEINRAGGIAGQSIELVIEDSAEDTPAHSVTAYQSLRRKNVSLIIGPTWSAAANALAPLARQDPNVLMISPSVGMRDFNEAGNNLFNLWPHDEYNAIQLARYAREQGIKTVALFSAQQIWSEMQSKTFKDEFERLGGQVLLEVNPIPDTRDLRVEAGKVARSGAEAVVFTCYSEQLGIAAAQLATFGFSGKKLSVLMYQPAIDAAKGSLDGAQYAAYPPPSPSFADSYQKRFHESPATSADKAYDAVKLLALAAVQNPSLDTIQIRDTIARTAQYQGASGTITFSIRGGVLQNPGMYQVRGTTMGLALEASEGAPGGTQLGALSSGQR